MVIRVRGTSRPQDTKVDHPVLTAAGLNLLCASPDIAPVTAKVVQERPRPKSPHVGEAPRTNVAGCPIAPTCLAGSGSSPREVGFLKKLTSCVSTRPTGPHPLRARELTTPHPEGLTTRLVPVEVDLKQQIFDVCSSLNNGHHQRAVTSALCQNRKWSVIRSRCITPLIRKANQLQRFDQHIEMFLMAIG